MALKIAFYHLFGLRHCSQEKKKKDKIQRMKTQEKSTRCPLTHALAKAVNLSQPGSLFFLPRWEGSQLLQLSTISCPMIPWAFFFFFFLKTLNVLLKICIHFSLHNNTKQYNYFCKEHNECKATHHPLPTLSPKRFRDATVSPSLVPPTHHHYHLWEK